MYDTSHAAIPLESVRQCVAENADVMFTPDPAAQDPILHRLARSTQVDVFIACVEGTTSPLDLTVRARRGRTVPHCIVYNGCVSGEDAGRMMAAVVHHVERHPMSKIDWEAQDVRGMTAIQLASRFHRLGSVWSSLKGMPHFDDMTQPIALQTVWEADFSSLPLDEQRCFDIQRADLQCGTESTARLAQLCYSDAIHGDADTAALDAVEAAVRSAADILYKPPGSNLPIVFYFVWMNQVSACLRCLRSRLKQRCNAKYFSVSHWSAWERW